MATISHLNMLKIAAHNQTRECVVSSIKHFLWANHILQALKCPINTFSATSFLQFMHHLRLMCAKTWITNCV